MRGPTHNAAKLSQKFLDKLGIQVDGNRGGASSTVSDLRTRQRKAARVEKKDRYAKQRYSHRIAERPRNLSIRKSGNPDRQIAVRKEAAVPRTKLKSILKDTKPIAEASQRHSEDTLPTSAPRISRGIKDRLAADDAEIASLEKALGVKGRKHLPNSFENDGLDELLENLDARNDQPLLSGKRKRSGEEKWLEQKRRKACGLPSTSVLPEERCTEQLSESEDLDGCSEDLDEGQRSKEETEYPTSFRANAELLDLQQKRVRENPYVAPVLQPIPKTKYIPPSLRGLSISDQEELSQLRRQLQGLLNRLSEANLVTIIKDIEGLYRVNPRKHVSTTLIDLLLGLLTDSSVLQDTFITLHAALVGALYKIIGIEFGAQAVQMVVEEFGKAYDSNEDSNLHSKKCTNLVSLLSELYNFQVIGSRLIYDFIRLFLEEFHEDNAVLLHKIVRNSGFQLRQDDPASLSDIISLLHTAVVKAGEDKLSVRTKVAVDAMNDLKNNRMRTNLDNTKTILESINRLKKTLRTLNVRSMQASEPLRISLCDVRNTDRKGQWWLVGANRMNQDQGKADRNVLNMSGENKLRFDDDDIEEVDGGSDLIQLAREQRMNTDVRRSIFIAIMSATDYRDAHLRLLKLRLRRSQELEITKVLIHCASAEESYNPFYTLISRQICSDRKQRMAFQFSLWGLFKRMGEVEDGVEEETADKVDQDEGLGMRNLVNLSKLFGILVVEGGLDLRILKTLNFAYLQPKTKVFLELMLITVIVHSQSGSDKGRNEKSLVELFMKLKPIPDLARGLHYFVRKTVSKTDVAGNSKDKELVTWGCRVASDTLRIIASSRRERE